MQRHACDDPHAALCQRETEILISGLKHTLTKVSICAITVFKLSRGQLYPASVNFEEISPIIFIYRLQYSIK